MQITRLMVRAFAIGGAAQLLFACWGCGEQTWSEQGDASVDAGTSERADTQQQPVTELVPDGIELANGQVGPESVAVDETFVYWSNFEDDRVMRVSKDGALSPSEVHRNDRGEMKDVAVNNTAVYWGGRSLYQQVKGTDTVNRLLVGGRLVYNIALSGGRVYWGDDQDTVRLKSMKPDGTDIQTHGASQSQSFFFAIDGDSAFVAQFVLDADDEGRIETWPLGGGTASVFAKTRLVWKVLVDDEYVYWLEGRNFGAIKKKRKTGVGETITLTEGFQILGPQSLAVHGSTLYWTQLGLGAGQGAVGAVSKGGGDAHLIAHKQTVPQGIAVDERFVYWVNYGPTHNGTIRKIAR